MKKKLAIFLLIPVVLCTLFIACGEDKVPEGTTGKQPATQDIETQDTTEQTDPTVATETDTTVPSGHIISYSEYLTLNGEQKKNLMSQFESQEAFDAWLAEIKKDYDAYMTTVKPTNPTSTEPNIPEKPTFPDVSDVTVPQKDKLTYSEYFSMSAVEQQAFINTFDSYDDFFEWYNRVLKEYEDAMTEIDGTGPDIVLGAD